MNKIIFVTTVGLFIGFGAFDVLAVTPADINKGMYETCMEEVSSNSELSTDITKSKNTCVCFGNKSEAYYKKHLKEFTEAKEKAIASGSRQAVDNLSNKMMNDAMEQCGMSDSSESGGMLSKGSLTELKKECPDFITNVLPDELLSQSKCTCNKVSAKDREQLIVIENRIAEIQKTVEEAERTGVISNSNAMLKEIIDLQNQAKDVFIKLAKKCKAGL